MGTNTTYHYKYWINGENGLVKGENTTNNTNFQIPSDLPEGSLYFSVESTNSKGPLIADKLNIVILPDDIPCPRVIAGKEMPKDSIVLRWLSVKNAHQYRIELFSSIAPTITAKQAAGVKPTPVHSEIVRDTTYSLPASLKGTTYFWRGSCDLNYENYSPIDSFKIAPRKDIPVTISDMQVQSGYSNLKTGVVFRYNKGGNPEAIITNASDGITKIFLYSIDGRRVFHSLLGDACGVYRVDFSGKGVGALRSGIYVVLIKIGAINLRKTFLIRQGIVL